MVRDFFIHFGNDKMVELKKNLIIMDTAKTLREKFNELIEKKKVETEKQKKNKVQRADKPKKQ